MAAVPESSLEAGLAALAQGDFPNAIAQLEACQQQLEHTPAKDRAQKALLEAYMQVGATDKAIALYQTLDRSNQSQAIAWVLNKYPELVGDETSFVAIEPASRTLAQQDSHKAKEQSKLPLLTPPAFEWRYAPRAKRWQSLQDVNLLPLWLLTAGSAIALFWLICALIKFLMNLINNILVQLPYLEPYQPFYSDPTKLILGFLLLLTVSSPWLLDLLLQQLYGLQPLSIIELAKTSPEASRTIQRYCRQVNWRLPQLRIFPTTAPIAMTYGNLPRTARIVVSQGLLSQLADDEIAAICALELGQIAHQDFGLMSVLMLLKQIFYTIYWYISLWGDRQVQPILYLAAAIASTAYGLWWLLGLPSLWLSQLRIYYSDRFAVNITGNPNGLTRALLKITIGIAQDTQQKEQTSPVVESLNLFLPTGYYQSITLGSYPHTDFTPILAWDCLNPYRYWLTINNTHPLLGDRLQRCARWCQQWHLEPELDLLNLPAKMRSPIWTRRFLLQIAPFFAVVLGLVFGCLTWLVGGIALLVWIPQLAWMFGDWLLIKAYLPIAYSIGAFIRINSLFPDITSTAVRAAPDLRQLLASPLVPIDSQPVRWQGKLLGRRGIGNWLGQDLILQSPQGAIALHYQSLLGPIGYMFLRQAFNPQDLIGRHVVVTGWFRRGATCWLDVDALQTQSGKTCRSNHPLWTTILAIAIALWGICTIVFS